MDRRRHEGVARGGECFGVFASGCGCDLIDDVICCAGSGSPFQKRLTHTSALGHSCVALLIGSGQCSAMGGVGGRRHTDTHKTGRLTWSKRDNDVVCVHVHHIMMKFTTWRQQKQKGSADRVRACVERKKERTHDRTEDVHVILDILVEVLSCSQFTLEEALCFKTVL